MFEAFILAGGGSSRMGRNKADIVIAGSTMLEKTAAALREAGASTITVVSSKQSFKGYGSIADVFEGRGALGGIHSALKHASGDLIFVAGCDFPFISSEFVKFLVDVSTSDGSDCVVPEQEDGRPQPLSAVYSREKCLKVCESMLTDEDSSNAVYALMDRLAVRLVRFDEYAHMANSRHLLMNVNTPEQLERAISFREQM
jgi:molybdopterin-guanine dinucleotide biosynthesis protein A